jgi:hypothetical protein
MIIYNIPVTSDSKSLSQGPGKRLYGQHPVRVRDDCYNYNVNAIPLGLGLRVRVIYAIPLGLGFRVINIYTIPFGLGLGL